MYMNSKTIQYNIFWAYIYTFLLTSFLVGNFSLLIYGIHTSSMKITQWSTYAVILGIFHLAEFFLIGVSSPQTLALSSFLLSNGWEYNTAIIVSWIEFFIESFLFPNFIIPYWLYLLSVISICIFLGIRFYSIYYAGQNFAHLIETEKSDKHKLVTTGIYKYFRHPAYFGWFWYSIFSQILLYNPICFFLYCYASWAFFKDRIPVEEYYLIQFFGNEYKEYKSRTFIGIPFIRNEA